MDWVGEHKIGRASGVLLWRRWGDVWQCIWPQHHTPLIHVKRWGREGRGSTALCISLVSIFSLHESGPFQLIRWLSLPEASAQAWLPRRICHPVDHRPVLSASLFTLSLLDKFKNSDLMCCELVSLGNSVFILLDLTSRLVSCIVVIVLFCGCWSNNVNVVPFSFFCYKTIWPELGDFMNRNW